MLLRATLPILGASIVLASSLESRQGICSIGPFPVTRCAVADHTKATWDIFRIDDFLISMIRTFGTSDNFPRFLLNNLAPRGSPNAHSSFDCSDIEKPANCVINGAFNADAGNCIFSKFGANTVCASFSSPEAGFLAVSYIDMYNGLRNHFLAVREAVDQLKSENFVNTMVDALTPKKEPIAPLVFKAIGGLVVDLLPVGGQVRAARTFIKKMRIVADAAPQDTLGAQDDLLSGLAKNEFIDEQNAANKQTLAQELEAIAVAVQNRMRNLLKVIHGPNQDPVQPADGEIRNTVAFQAHMNGQFLDDLPAVGDLRDAMKLRIKEFLVSQLINALGYVCIIDTTALADAPGSPGGVCRAGGGIPVSLGCAFFHIGSKLNPGILDRIFDDGVIEGATRAENIQGTGVNLVEAINNAKACNEGTLDQTAFLGLDNNDGTPKCMFNFKVVVTDL